MAPNDGGDGGESSELSADSSASSSGAPFDSHTSAHTVASRPARKSGRTNDGIIGTAVGGYVIQSHIGSGGMGDVYQAVHPRLKLAVAVKVMQKSESASTELSARFEAEARMIAKLAHPNIVSVLDSGCLRDGSPYILMELLTGSSLADRLEERELQAHEILEVVLQLCAAVATAHRHQIVHRDLKPGNVFLVEQGDREVVKVLDFGIAKLSEKEDTDFRTRTQAVLGTPQYMSPEQARQSADVKATSDIYSIGVLIYRLVTGKLPYRVVSAGDLIYHVLSKGRLAADLTDVPREWRSTVERCMAVQPEDRFANAEALLLHILANFPGSLAVGERVIPDEVSKLKDRSALLRHAERRRRVSRFAGIAAGSLAVAAAAGWWVSHWEPTPARPEIQAAPQVPVAPPSPAPVAIEEPPATEATEAAVPLVDMLFVSRPSGAQIELPSLGRRIEAPDRLSLPHGAHRMIVSRAGYRTFERVLEVDGSTDRVELTLVREGRRTTSWSPAGDPAPTVESTPPTSTVEETPRETPAPEQGGRLDPQQLFRTRH